MLVEAAESAKVLFHVQPDGQMFCLVDQIRLHPTPNWLCHYVAVQTGRRTAEALAEPHGGCSVRPEQVPESAFCQEGYRVLLDMAPCVIQLPFELLHSPEEGSS